MGNPVPLTLRCYALRPLELDDAEWVLRARNSEQVRPFMVSQHVITPDEHRRWIEQRISGHAETPYFIFTAAGKPLGVVGVSRYDNASGRGDWGFYLYGTPPKGAGTCMLGAFLDEMLLRRKLRGMTAQVLVSNTRSLRLHQKLGFHEEGVIHTGEAGDAVVFSLSRQQWQEQRHAFAESIQQVEIKEPDGDV